MLSCNTSSGIAHCSPVSDRCSHLVDVPHNWKVVFLSDEDRETCGFMYLAGKSVYPQKLIIDQPTLRPGMTMQIQELLALSTLMNVTDVVIRSSLSVTVPYLSKMPKLTSVSIAHAPFVTFSTFVLCTKFLQNLTNYNLVGLQMSEANFQELVTQCCEQLHVLEVSLCWSKESVEQALTACKSLVRLDFHLKPISCGQEWLSLLAVHGVAKIGCVAVACFKHSGLL